ncbi:MAG: methionyl-tRNA formyltransferase [Clostridiales bacterium]|nr:methionyl-tRNA formyltransferase [Clostridiales bacterium]
MARIVFMGTPEFAVPSLEALASSGHEVVGAFAQPDRPVGRGHKLAPCPVKARAEALGIPVFQFEKIRCPEGVAQLAALAPDIAVTAAFGQILTQELLDIPKKGVINVHASLLPRHRGSAPINQAILMGDEKTGITIMQTERGLDTGPMFASAETPIDAGETAGQLAQRLSLMGAKLLAEKLDDILEGALTPVAQDADSATYEPMLTRDMGVLDFALTATELDRRVRGLDPWPGTYTESPLGRLKVFMVRPMPDGGKGAPGEVLVSDPKGGLIVACRDGAVELVEIQLPGGRRMAAKACLQGKAIPVGTMLGTP